MKVRAANSDDVALILAFISKKAEFDRAIGAYQGTIQTSEAKIRQTMFNSYPFAYVLFAEDVTGICGFALYGFRYSSFVGQPSIWLDDLYVDENSRSQGAGTLVMDNLKQIALKNKCTHLAWTADARNIRGLKFYRRIGAEITNCQGDRCFLQWIV